MTTKTATSLAALKAKWDRREPMTQKEMATLLGVSRAVIARIEHSALKKLRAAMNKSPHDPRTF
jgi:DNA-directed RNA polymerase sigma subunit (sigma70/sigma32)